MRSVRHKDRRGMQRIEAQINEILDSEVPDLLGEFVRLPAAERERIIRLSAIRIREQRLTDAVAAAEHGDMRPARALVDAAIGYWLRLSPPSPIPARRARDSEPFSFSAAASAGGQRQSLSEKHNRQIAQHRLGRSVNKSESGGEGCRSHPQDCERTPPAAPYRQFLANSNRGSALGCRRRPSPGMAEEQASTPTPNQVESPPS
jgi:hypothetical protein